MPLDSLSALTTIALIVLVLFGVVGIATCVFAMRFFSEGTKAILRFVPEQTEPDDPTEALITRVDPMSVAPVPPENPHAPPTPAFGIPRPPAWRPPPSDDPSERLLGPEK